MCLLLGDASYDRRNYLGFGYWDLVPTMNVSLIYEETGSDDALADLDHNGVAEMAIGRVPARSQARCPRGFEQNHRIRDACKIKL